MTQGDEETEPSLAELRDRLDRMERFFTRRFDEVSAEVNAASQLVGMAEDTVKRRFGEVIEVIEALSRHQESGSSHQAGVELDAVVRITEDAANRILDAVDRMAERLDDESIWTDPERRTQAITAMKDDIQEILLASSFQDLTSQRIRSAMENLEEIEQRLSSTLQRFGIDVKPYQNQGERLVGRTASQEAINQLFEGQEGEGPASQADIDAMFDAQTGGGGANGADSGGSASSDGEASGGAEDVSQNDIDSMFDK